MTEIGNLIRKHRFMMMLTQAELGEMLGVGSQYISNIERGAALPPKRRFAKFVQRLKMDKTQAYFAFNNDIMKKLKLWGKNKHNIEDEYFN